MKNIPPLIPQVRWGLTWKRPKAMHYHENWAVEEEVAHFLYGFVKMVKPKNILEIGTFEGVSACAIGQALKDIKFGKLWTIDNKDYGQKEYIKNQYLESYVECIIGSSPTEIFEIQQKEGIKFDICFIDDGHEFDEALRDLLVCDKVIRQFGYILGHDVLECETVNNALNHFLEEYPNRYEKIIISSYNGLFILRKLI
jgi:predicted O-methyltransferase YrrM